MSRDSWVGARSKTKTGWTVGGVGEYRFGRWSLKGEYLYYYLGEESLSTQLDDNTLGQLGIYQNSSFESKGHIARMGLNVKFGHRSGQPVPLE